MLLSNINKFLFKLYIIVLPFDLFLGINRYTYSLSFYIQLIGLVLLLLTCFSKMSIKFEKSLYNIFFIFIFLSIISMITTIMLNDKIGTLFGQTPYMTSIKVILNYLHVVSIFFYNSIMLKEIGLYKLNKYLNIIINTSLIIGYIQIMMIIGVPLISNIYDKINFLGLLVSSQHTLTMARASVLSSEPATNAIMIVSFCLPYLYGKLITRQNIKKVLIKILLFLPIIYFTKSSSVYIAFIVFIICMLIHLIKERQFLSKYFKEITLGSLLCIILFTTFFIIKQDSINIDDSLYILQGKLFDKNNLSTIYRSSTVQNSIKIFKKYPISGVGNGNQGFFYREHIEPWMLKSYEVNKALSGEWGVLNGGAFIPSLISGYGIIGIVVFIIFVIKYNRLLNKNKNILGHFYYMIKIGGLCFLITSIMSSDIIRNYPIIFILSIAFANFNKEDKIYFINGEMYEDEITY